MISIFDAILDLYPDFKGGSFVNDPTNESEYEAINWTTEVDSSDNAIYGSRPSGVPTWSEAKAKYDELVIAYNNQEYARLRRKAYPDWQEQLNYIYDNGIDKWKTNMVDPIKNKYPKP